MPAQFILDGYTATKTFERNPFYDQTVVRYRPLTGLEIRQLRRKLVDLERPHGKEATDASLRAGEEYFSEFAAKRIIEWDVLDGGGHAVPISAKSIMGLAPQLGADILNLIIGEIPPDGAPEPDSPDESIEQTLAKSEEADAKN